MAVVGTGLSTPGIRSEFFQRFDEVNKKTFWERLSTRVPSNTAKETYKFLGSVPPMREWGTGRKARGIFAESYDIENLKYESTLEVDRDEIDDDQLGQIRLRIRELADRAATHKDSEIARLLENGGNAGFNSYDSKTFFAADHTSGKSGNQSNILAPSAATPTDPTVAEFRTAMKDGLTRILSFKDDQGEPMSFGASGMVAVVPPSMMLTAAEALNTTLVNSGSTNVLQGAAEIVTFPYFTASDAFYLLKTDVAVKGIVFQDRMPLEFTAQERDSESGFRREKYEYGVRARYRLTYGYWQFALRLKFA